MKGATVLLIQADIVKLLESEGLIDGNGDFVTPTETQIAELIIGVVSILKRRGVVIPPKIDKAIQSVPLVLQIVA